MTCIREEEDGLNVGSLSSNRVYWNSPNFETILWWDAGLGPGGLVNILGPGPMNVSRILWPVRNLCVRWHDIAQTVRHLAVYRQTLCHQNGTTWHAIVELTKFVPVWGLLNDVEVTASRQRSSQRQRHRQRRTSPPLLRTMFGNSIRRLQKTNEISLAFNVNWFTDFIA